ncbi:trehalase, partial [Helicosporidium sp. ATCC 50920]
PPPPPLTSIYASLPPMEFLRLVYPSMLREYAYWTSDLKQVRVAGANGTHLLARYNAELEGPRPESYTEDVRTARAAGFDPERPSPACRQLWRDLASGAESGWDFGQRWFADPAVGLPSIRTTQILPVDLNSFLLQAELAIADVAAALGDAAEAERTRTFAEQRHAAVQELMWDESGGRWRD